MKFNEISLDGQGGGSVATRLLQSGMKANALRTNAILRKDEWNQYDTAIIRAAQLRLTGVQDLMSKGLVYSFANGLGKTVLEYEDMSDVNEAEMNMDGLTRGKNDTVEFDLKFLPLPIIHKSYMISARTLAASRNGNTPLDTTNAERAARKVAEKMETLLFLGSNSFTFGAGTIYGYIDAPNRNQGSLVHAWDASGVTGTDIINDVKRMKQASINARHYGPWTIYVPTAYETKLDEDFKTYSDKTIRERILDIAGVSDVKVADFLTTGNVLMVEMVPETVRLVQGLPVTNIEWQTEGNMMFHFKVMTICVPQIRADQNGRSGITHFTA